MIKKVALALTIVLLAVLAIFVVKEQKEEEASIERYQKMDSELRPLNIEKDSLEEALHNLDIKYEAEKMHKATTQLLFGELDERLYDECYPIMEEYGYVGVLSVAHDQLPGMKGNITVKQCEELLDEGWSICVKWDATVSVKKWWPTLQTELAKLNLEPGNVVYFPEKTYNEKFDKQIKEMGFEIVVYHAQETSQMFQLGDEEGLWHLGAIGCMEHGPKARLEEAIVQKANITYLVGFQLSTELYDKEYFSSMLDCFKDYEETNELLVSTMQDARTHFQQRGGAQEKSKLKAYNKEKSELEGQLAEVQAKIDEVHRKYE